MWCTNSPHHATIVHNAVWNILSGRHFNLEQCVSVGDKMLPSWAKNWRENIFDAVLWPITNIWCVWHSMTACYDIIHITSSWTTQITKLQRLLFCFLSVPLLELLICIGSHFYFFPLFFFSLQILMFFMISFCLLP
jgi:hypothetical protein